MKLPHTYIALAAALLVANPFALAQEEKRGDAPRDADRRAEADRAPDKPDRPKAESRRDAAKPKPKPKPKAESRTDSPKPKPKPAKPAKPEAEKRTYLGVATSPVHPSLSQHLGLDEGFGIQVEQAMEKSPAGKAGLKASDVLVKLDDQLLTSPEHLSLLVRSKESGDEITLTLIRKGQEQTVDVKLGEKEESAFFTRPRGGPGPRHWHEPLQRKQDYWRGWMERNRPETRRDQEHRGRRHESADDPRKGRQHRPAEEGRPARGGGAEKPTGRPPAVSVQPGFPVKIFGAEGIVKIDNDHGELTIVREDGDHRIEIKDEDGEVVHEGAFDPKQGVEGLPGPARKQLETMKLDNLEILAPEAPEKDPEKTIGPSNEEDADRGNSPGVPL
ncbi:MAG: PDZ domain-containing protein [Verrucomicrobiales bacterium]